MNFLRRETTELCGEIVEQQKNSIRKERPVILLYQKWLTIYIEGSPKISFAGSLCSCVMCVWREGSLIFSHTAFFVRCYSTNCSLMTELSIHVEAILCSRWLLAWFPCDVSPRFVKHSPRFSHPRNFFFLSGGKVVHTQSPTSFLQPSHIEFIWQYKAVLRRHNACLHSFFSHSWARPLCEIDTHSFLCFSSNAHCFQSS